MIRITDNSDSDLDHWANRLFDSAYGLRCSTPGMAGEPVCGICGGSGTVATARCPGCKGKSTRGHGELSGTRQDDERSPSERAYARERRIREQLSRCSDAQVQLLYLTWRRPTNAAERTLHSKLGTYALAVPPEDDGAVKSSVVFQDCRMAVLGSETARLQYFGSTGINIRASGTLRVAGGADPRLALWLVGISGAAFSGPQKSGADAKRVRIREGTEAELVSALHAYGAQLEGLTLPESVSLRELGRRTGLSDHGAKAEARRRGVDIMGAGRGRAATVWSSELLGKWPEAMLSGRTG